MPLTTPNLLEEPAKTNGRWNLKKASLFPKNLFFFQLPKFHFVFQLSALVLSLHGTFPDSPSLVHATTRCPRGLVRHATTPMGGTSSSPARTIHSGWRSVVLPMTPSFLCSPSNEKGSELASLLVVRCKSQFFFVKNDFCESIFPLPCCSFARSLLGKKLIPMAQKGS